MQMLTAGGDFHPALKMNDSVVALYYTHPAGKCNPFFSQRPSGGVNFLKKGQKINSTISMRASRPLRERISRSGNFSVIDMRPALQQMELP